MRFFPGLLCSIKCLSIAASWKSPINLNQESHERLKRCHSDPVPGPKPKRPARSASPPLEIVLEVINVRKLVPRSVENPLRVIFSQVENVEGLTKAVT